MLNEQTLQTLNALRLPGMAAAFDERFAMLVDRELTWRDAGANGYLDKRYRCAHNTEFAVRAAEPVSAFVEFIGNNLGDILCERFERSVGNDNCVRFHDQSLQIPADVHRAHYVKAKINVHRYEDGTLAIFHGPRCLARYSALGNAAQPKPKRERNVRFVACTVGKGASGYAPRTFAHTDIKADKSFVTKPDKSICSRQNGRVTVLGKSSDDLAPGTLSRILKQAQLKD